MKKKKYAKPKLLLGPLFKKLAKKIGATVVVEPEWGVVGSIKFTNGKTTYFRYNSLDLNGVGSSEVAKDKGYARYFMKRMGYSVVPYSQTFYRNDWAKAVSAPDRRLASALRYADSLGYPVVVKPNSLSQGKSVSFAHSRRECREALEEVFLHDKIAIVESVVKGNDYRIVVLDGQVISAYGRTPLTVVGDGRSTIRSLLLKKQRQFKQDQRDTNIDPDDRRLVAKLRQKRLSLKSVIKTGEVIELLDNANLSSGGDSVHINMIDPKFEDLATRLTKDMGLRLCGVDLMIDGDLSKYTKRHWILEVNSAPGLDHFVKTGTAQRQIVEDLYLKVLKNLESK